METVVVTYELRPCLVGAKKVKGLFHRWVEDAHAGSVGIIEYENGKVVRVTPKNIIFLDSASKFDEFDWSTSEEGDKNESKS